MELDAERALGVRLLRDDQPGRRLRHGLRDELLQTRHYGAVCDPRRCAGRALSPPLPAPRPLSVRISASDWAGEGLPERDLVALAKMLKAAGVDIINVSTGQVVEDQDPEYGRMYQAPFADCVRNEAGVPTIVAGNVVTADGTRELIEAGADVVKVGVIRSGLGLRCQSNRWSSTSKERPSTSI